MTEDTAEQHICISIEIQLAPPLAGAVTVQGDV